MRRILFIIIFMLTLVDINYGQTPVKRQTQKGTTSSPKISKSTPKPYGSSAKSTAAKDGQRFVQDGVTYGVMSVIDKTLKLVKANKSVTHYQIPSQLKVNGVNYTVTSIEGHAFEGCSSLTSVTIPSSVTTIEGHAFEGCSSLTSVTIPGSVKTIGSGAFEGCGSLTSVTIPSSVTTIEDHAFSGCGSLTSVTIPSSVTTIKAYAFAGCSSLTSVTIPGSVMTIGERAFSICRSLKSVTIPSSVKTIGEHAFPAGCRVIRVNP